MQAKVFAIAVGAIVAVTQGPWLAQRAEATTLSISGSGTYSRQDSSNGSYTFPVSGTFSVDLSGQVGVTADNGSVTFSGFPPTGPTRLELFAGKLSNGVDIVQGYAFYQDFQLGLQLVVDDAMLALIAAYKPFDLTSNNSTLRVGYLVYYSKGDNIEHYYLADDNYTLSGQISAPQVSIVPLPASAPLFSAGLLALGSAGYARRRTRVA